VEYATVVPHLRQTRRVAFWLALCSHVSTDNQATEDVMYELEQNRLITLQTTVPKGFKEWLLYPLTAEKIGSVLNDQRSSMMFKSLASSGRCANM